MKTFYKVGGYEQWINVDGNWNCTCPWGSSWRWTKKSIAENKKCVHIKLAHVKQKKETIT